MCLQFESGKLMYLFKICLVEVLNSFCKNELTWVYVLSLQDSSSSEDSADDSSSETKKKKHKE